MLTLILRRGIYGTVCNSNDNSNITECKNDLDTNCTVNCVVSFIKLD
jgi:hypothetical protein